MVGRAQGREFPGSGREDKPGFAVAHGPPFPPKIAQIVLRRVVAFIKIVGLQKSGEAEEQALLPAAARLRPLAEPRVGTAPCCSYSPGRWPIPEKLSPPARTAFRCVGRPRFFRAGEARRRLDQSPGFPGVVFVALRRPGRFCGLAQIKADLGNGFAFPGAGEEIFGSAPEEEMEDNLAEVLLIGVTMVFPITHVGARPLYHRSTSVPLTEIRAPMKSGPGSRFHNSRSAGLQRFPAVLAEPRKGQSSPA